MIYLREALMTGGAALPYDAEVEYLESTGTQYINTGVYPGIGDVLECTFKLGSITIYGALFGCSWTSDGVLPAVWIKSTSKIHALYCGGSFEGSTNTYSTGDVLNLDVSLQSNNLSTYINGVLLRKTKGSASFPSIPYHIFCTTNASGSAPYNAAGSGTKCYGFRIYKGGVLLRDMIPVRFTNENGVTEGAMYDRVSGQLFRNRGTGAFVIGPDK